ncbi:glycoside hydrolase family 10 protein [Bacteroides sedimenti]|uniref:Glycosyl hydrolase-like 10 domain-containing protein n=1 Tax=Bacteroides sedimenti TaxID=2136147 RepID=A0ABN6ZAW2_9BACE
MKIKALLATLLMVGYSLFSTAHTIPKREFRGVWIHTLNGDYTGKSPQEFKTYLISQLNEFHEAGINAILFQVRPEADAFYSSKLEPWSRFLTGTQGVAPEGGWDPMAFVIEECHKRCMEFHAWVNPYRVQLNIKSKLAPTHIYYQHPEWFVEYGNQRYFNPGMPQSREFINKVIKDIVSRYDVDAIHMDDYFYPYPIAGKEFPDEEAFQKYGVPDGFVGQKDNWRRSNVNSLIRELHETIRETKPWVKFGVSPFGIYRNKKNTPDGIGSETNGLQNYDQLYADVLLWIRNGWVDYNIPQIYWEIGNKAADHETLVNWWAAYSYDRPFFIGQDVERTVKFADLNNPNISQIPRKMQLSRTTPNVSGNCFWSGKALLGDPGNFLTVLKKNYQSYPALQPKFSFIDDKAPKSVRKLKAKWTAEGYLLTWREPKATEEMDKAAIYCVYRFENKEKINLEDPSKIVTITRDCFYKLPYDLGKVKYRYVVTALDRLQNESKMESKKIKL